MKWLTSVSPVCSRQWHAGIHIPGMVHTNMKGFDHTQPSCMTHGANAIFKQHDVDEGFHIEFSNFSTEQIKTARAANINIMSNPFANNPSINNPSNHEHLKVHENEPAGAAPLPAALECGGPRAWWWAASIVARVAQQHREVRACHCITCTSFGYHCVPRRDGQMRMTTRVGCWFVVEFYCSPALVQGVLRRAQPVAQHVASPCPGEVPHWSVAMSLSKVALVMAVVGLIATMGTTPHNTSE